MKLLGRQEKKKKNVRNAKAKAKPATRRVDINPNTMLFTGFGILIGVLCVATWLKLLDPKTLPLRTVQLEASFKQLSKQELHGLISQKIDGGFFSVDVDGIKASLNAQPWVSEAEVRRVWPDTLHVVIKEQVAVARWRDQALVGARGELFYPPKETFPADLIVLDGPEETVGQMANKLGVFNRALKGIELDMTRLVLTERRAWEFELSSSMVVALGRKDVEQRLNRFVKFFPQLEKREADMKRIDMRYTNGFAVQWRA